MATVTVYTAARMQEIEDQAVVDGEVVGDNLVLVRHNGATINAGSVRGPQGIQGPTGDVSEAELAGEVATLEAADAALDSRLDSVESSVSSHDSQLSTNTSNIATNTADIGDINDDLDDRPLGLVADYTYGGTTSLASGATLGPSSFNFVNGRKYNITLTIGDLSVASGFPTWQFTITTNGVHRRNFRKIPTTAAGGETYGSPPCIFTASGSRTNYAVEVGRITGAGNLNIAPMGTTPTVYISVEDLGV